MKYSEANKPEELEPKDLRWRCTSSSFSFATTEEIEPIENIVGQERALKALKLGVGLWSPGYNIFITGLSGTGKATTIKKMLEKMADDKPQLLDYVYVNNFFDTDNPMLITFPAGSAKDFKKEYFDLLRYLREALPQVFESDSFVTTRDAIVEEYKKSEREIFAAFDEKIGKEQFVLGQVEIDGTPKPDVMLVIEDKPHPIHDLERLLQEKKITPEEADERYEKYLRFREELVHVFKRSMKMRLEAQEKLDVVEKREAEVVIKGAVNVLKEKYTGERVSAYLTQVEEYTLQNLRFFTTQTDDENQEQIVARFFRQFEVNIILDNSSSIGRPVVIEITPTNSNLFGTIDRQNDGNGGWTADFTNIKCGSLLRANSGFLVLNVRHVLDSPLVWRNLKRTLNYRRLNIQDGDGHFAMSPISLKPEPIEIDAKVILVGGERLYSVLAGHDDDFKKIFKVKVEFDYEVNRTKELLQQYARVIKKMIRDENLLEFQTGAIGYLMEIAARFAGNKNRLTSRFSILADIVREANFWACDEEAAVVTADHVKTAFKTAHTRHNLSQIKIIEMIQQGDIKIDTTGKLVGEINGLAVLPTDYMPFGLPTKISATVALGSGRITSIDREAGFTGRIFEKWVLILTGYFRSIFGLNMLLPFSANIAFEQQYYGIDGDSASAAELCVLLSALAGIPIDQSIAITGSVNQKGDIQVIGGINEKIEGFYGICKMRSLTGTQGVILPAQNVDDLMLADEVVESVRKKEFHIYPVGRIEQAIEILTGVEAGTRKKDGTYPENTVYGKVERAIIRMHETLLESASRKKQIQKPEEKTPVPQKTAAQKRGGKK